VNKVCDADSHTTAAAAIKMDNAVQAHTTETTTSKKDTLSRSCVDSTTLKGSDDDNDNDVAMSTTTQSGTGSSVSENGVARSDFSSAFVVVATAEVKAPAPPLSPPPAGHPTDGSPSSSPQPPLSISIAPTTMLLPSTTNNNNNNNNNNAKTSTATFAALRSANRVRTSQMVHSLSEWKRWRKSWQTLKQQHAAAALPANLEARPVYTWQHLNKREKWSKSTVLTLLRLNHYENNVHGPEHATEDHESGNGNLHTAAFRMQLPEALREDKFEVSAPPALVRDRDIFLARLDTRQSITYYQRCARTARQAQPPAAAPPSNNSTTTSGATTTTTSSSMPASLPRPASGPRTKKPKSSERAQSSNNICDAILSIPQPLRSDATVWQHVVQRHAALLTVVDFVNGIPVTHWSCRDFFRAASRGIHHVLQSDHALVSHFQYAWMRFAPHIRNNADLVRSVMEEAWATCTSSSSSSTTTTPNGATTTIANHPSRALPTPYFELIRSLLKSPSTNSDSNHLDDDQKPMALLRNSKAFALYVICAFSSALPANAIRAFSKRLQNDADICREAVTANGQCLQYVPFHFRRDATICQAALESDPRALVSCHIPKWKRDVARVQSCFERLRATDGNGYIKATSTAFAYACPTQVSYRRLFKELPAKLRENLDICFGALCSGSIAVADLPRCVQTSTEFWPRVLFVCPHAWYQMPPETARTAQLARSLGSIQTIDMAEEIFEAMPELCLERDFWLKIVQSPSFGESYDEFLEIAPEFVWLDKEIMVLAASKTHEVLELLQEYPLSEDRDVVVAGLGTSPPPEALYELSGWVQVMYPDLVALAIRNCDTDSIWDVYDSIEEPLWHEEQVVHAWLARGGDYLHEEFLPETEYDEQAFLLIAEHNPEDFWYAANELCTDKGYLSRVLNVNPLLFRDLPTPQLAHDYDLALVALGGSFSSTTPTHSSNSAEVERKRRNLVGWYDINDGDDFVFWTEFAVWVHDQVLMQESFVSLILGGIMSSTCHLSVLNQGYETSLVYKKLLAEFVGVPMGQRLAVFRKASANLVRWGY
jgi:hypothetical protein